VETERYGIIGGNGVPSICLGMARREWMTSCCLATDLRLGIEGQTRQIFDIFDAHLGESGSDISKVLFAQVWLKRMSDYAAMNMVWNNWIDPDHPPARSCVRADMANPDHLIEIRITAARPL
jgi:enamine deaminase RidA (YjgF/YER057c/UK114 family)